VHGDIKSANVVIDEKKGHAKITDFGASILPGGYAPPPGSVLHQPPEWILKQERTTAGDIWQAGVLLYKLVTAKYPFTSKVEDWTGKSVDEIETYRRELEYEIVHKEPTRPSSINHFAHGRLEDVIMACLKKDPSERPSAKKALWMLRPTWWYEAIGGGAVLGTLLGLGLLAWHMATPQDPNRLIYIARQNESSEIFSVDTKGHAKKQLTNNSHDEGILSLSNDKSAITYIRRRPQSNSLLLRNIDHGDEESIFTAEMFGRTSWSPDNSQFAVFATSTGGERLMLFDNRGNVKKEIPCPVGKDLQWHPDGEFLSYVKAGLLHLVTPEGKHRIAKHLNHVKAHAWTDRGLLLSTHKPAPFGEIRLLHGENQEYEGISIANVTREEEVSATKIMPLRDESGYWFLSLDGFWLRKWDRELKGISLNQGRENIDKKIISAVEGKPGEFFVIAREKDMDGSGELDDKDNEIYRVQRKGEGWYRENVPGPVGVEDLLFVPR